MELLYTPDVILYLYCIEKLYYNVMSLLVSIYIHGNRIKNLYYDHENANTMKL